MRRNGYMCKINSGYHRSNLHAKKIKKRSDPDNCSLLFLPGNCLIIEDFICRNTGLSGKLFCIGRKERRGVHDAGVNQFLCGCIG